MIEKSDINNLLTVKEASKIVPFTTPTLYSYIWQGRINHIKVGKKIYINKADLQDFVNNLTQVIPARS
jgi:excisionase family DNA binding protein